MDYVQYLNELIVIKNAKGLPIIIMQFGCDWLLRFMTLLYLRNKANIIGYLILQTIILSCLLII